MNHAKAEIEKVKPGDLMQINPEHADYPLAIAVVIKPESWGATLGLVTIVDKPAVYVEANLPWSAIEPTGGRLVFNANGTRYEVPPPPQTHHP